MTWPTSSIGSVGCCYGQHGNQTEPAAPSRVPPSAHGCGDYPAWLGAESGRMSRDERQVREDRFCPFDGELPDGVGGELVPTPWAGERHERVEIAGELMAEGLRGTELDGAIDLTVFARRFVRWAEDGFPMEIGGGSDGNN